MRSTLACCSALLAACAAAPRDGPAAVPLVLPGPPCPACLRAGRAVVGAVDASWEHPPALDAWIRDLTARWAVQSDAQPLFERVDRLHAPVLGELFPGASAVVVAWRLQVLPTERGRHASIPGSLGATLLIAGDAIAGEFSHYGNYEAYGNALRDFGVRLATIDDARAIWRGFNELHQKAWASDDHVRVDEKHWQIGIQIVREQRYWYEVDVDGRQIVVAARLRCAPVAGSTGS